MTTVIAVSKGVQNFMSKTFDRGGIHTRLVTRVCLPANDDVQQKPAEKDRGHDEEDNKNHSLFKITRRWEVRSRSLGIHAHFISLSRTARAIVGMAARGTPQPAPASTPGNTPSAL